MKKKIKLIHIHKVFLVVDHPVNDIQQNVL